MKFLTIIFALVVVGVLAPPATAYEVTQLGESYELTQQETEEEQACESECEYETLTIESVTPREEEEEMQVWDVPATGGVLPHGVPAHVQGSDSATPASTPRHHTHARKGHAHHRDKRQRKHRTTRHRQQQRKGN